MDIRVGQHSPRTGFFDCNRCRHTVHLEDGEPVAACNHCGNDTFGERLLNVALNWQKEDIERRT